MKLKGIPMKIKRHLAPVAGALLLVTGAASMALLGGGGAASAAGTPSSAFGIELVGAGNNVIPPTPAVESTDGSLVTDSLIALPPNPVVSGGVINASAENGHAVASVTDLGVGDGLLAQLPAQLTTQLDTVCQQLSTALNPVTGPVQDTVVGPLVTQLDGVLAQVGSSTAGTPIDLSALDALDITHLTNVQLDGLCDVLSGAARIVGAGTVEAECNGTTGTTTIADLRALGIPVNIDTSQANQKVAVGGGQIPGLVDITVNKQTSNADGTFTVTALAVNLLGQIDLNVASATCGEVTRDAPGGPDTPDEPDAPAPSPIKSHAPVTG